MEAASARATVCGEARRSAEAAITRIVDSIRGSIPEYLSLDYGEHHANIEQRCGQLLDALRAGRQPSDSDVQVGADIGRRRAELGIPAIALQRGYQVIYHEVGMLLLNSVTTLDEQTAVNQMLTELNQWVQAFSRTAIQAHAESFSSERIALGARLERLFRAGAADSPEVSEALRAARLEPGGKFSAVAVAGLGLDATRRLEATLLPRELAYVVIRTTEEVSFLGHEEDLRVIFGLLVGTASVGLGATYQGPQAAWLALTSAKKALALARARGTGLVRFQEDWAHALLLHHLHELRPIVQSARDAAIANSQLLETVVAFASHRFSLAETGRSLHIHPNTAAYRLGKWRDATQSDPWVVSSLLAAQLVADLGAQLDAPSEIQD